MEEEYEGSVLFAGLAKCTGLTLDQVNFFMSQLVALVIAGAYRKLIPNSTRIRHSYGTIIGLALLYFCYGNNCLHALLLPSICYFIMCFLPRRTSHVGVLSASLLYLCGMHLHRIYYNYGFSGVDVSGPIMVMVQKTTNLAFSLHDGTFHSQNHTQLQKKYALNKIPNPMEYFSYIYMFPTLLAGPVVHYKDYIEFIEGHDQSSKFSPRKAVIKKVVIAFGCCAIFTVCRSYFTASRLKDEQFLENTDFSYKLWYLAVSTNLVRFKYYFAWIMADAICNNAGLGFNGVDPQSGEPKWDKISNVDIIQFEFATSMKEAIEGWNKGTNVWLRFIVYERVTKYKLLLTYLLSAIWHGFYPGYYITFFTGALFTYCARIVRKNIRNYFTSNTESKKFYDISTFILTRFALAYLTFPFIIFEFWASVALYNKLYYYLHIISFLTIILVPNCLPRNLNNKDQNKENAQIMRALRSGSYRID